MYKYAVVVFVTFQLVAASHIALGQQTKSVDYRSLSAEKLVELAAEEGVAITVADDCSLTIDPKDLNRRLTAALISKSDDVAKCVDVEKWMRKHIVGTWKCVKDEETSFGTFRKDGILEVRREHNNAVLGALNSVINGKYINYRWELSESDLYTRVDSSETKNLDKLNFLEKSDSAKLEFVDKNHIKAKGENGIGSGNWVRTGK